MKRDVILRHNRESNSDQTYVCHSHPFTSLPYLKSHIRPQFVIFNAGLKLLKAVDQKRVLDQQTALEQQQIETLVDDSPDLTFVMDLYKAWVWERPKGFEKELSYISPDDVDVVDVDAFDVDDDDDNDLDYDDSAPRSKKRKRKAPAPLPNQKSPTRRPPKRPRPKGKQKVLSVPSRHRSLSKMTLSRLEQLGRASWTSKSIRKWSILRRSRSSNYSYSSSIVN
jgi:hypothetical protein